MILMTQLSATVASASWNSSIAGPATACSVSNGTLMNVSIAAQSNANPPIDLKLFAAQSHLPFLGCGILQRVNVNIWNADPLLYLTYALMAIFFVSSNVLAGGIWVDFCWPFHTVFELWFFGAWREVCGPKGRMNQRKYIWNLNQRLKICK